MLFHAELLFVGGLPFCTSAKPDLSVFCVLHTTVCHSSTDYLAIIARVSQLHVSLRVASHSSPRCTLRSSALHVSHDSWALSDPHVSSPARCEAIMGSPLSMLASHNCDTLLHFSSAFESEYSVHIASCLACLVLGLFSAFEFRIV